jgi:DNA-binding NarL/FixJ family response regulator
MIVVSVHDHSSVRQSVLDAGADGFVLKRALATDLLAATDAVLAGQSYVSPDTRESRPGGGPTGSSI